MAPWQGVRTAIDTGNTANCGSKENTPKTNTEKDMFPTCYCCREKPDVRGTRAMIGPAPQKALPPSSEKVKRTGGQG